MTDIKNILTTLLALLKSALESAYYQQPIPSETDDGISRVLSGLLTSDQTDLKLISDGVLGDEARVLGLFAERMASLAVRENSVNPIKQGLMALLIYARTEDPRDVLLVLSLLHDASVKISGNPKQVFDEVSAVFGETELLSDFLNRSDEDKSIDAMGYEESKTTEGFLYARNWQFDVTKGPDFIVNSSGSAVHASQSKLKKSITDAGATKRGPSTNTTETGEIFDMNTANGPMEIRIMDGRANGGPLQGPRTVVTRPNTKEYVHGNGARIEGAVSKAERRAAGHFHGQTP